MQTNMVVDTHKKNHAEKSFKIHNDEIGGLIEESKELCMEAKAFTKEVKSKGVHE